MGTAESAHDQKVTEDDSGEDDEDNDPQPRSAPLPAVLTYAQKRQEIKSIRGTTQPVVIRDMATPALHSSKVVYNKLMEVTRRIDNDEVCMYVHYVHTISYFYILYI